MSPSYNQLPCKVLEQWNALPNDTVDTLIQIARIKIVVGKMATWSACLVHIYKQHDITLMDVSWLSNEVEETMAAGWHVGTKTNLLILAGNCSLFYPFIR